MTIRGIRAGRLGTAGLAATVVLLLLLGVGSGSSISGAASSGHAAIFTSIPYTAQPLSGQANTVVATVNVVGGPTSLGATFDPSNGYVYFGSNGTNLTAIDGASNTIAAQIDIGPYASPATPNYVGGAVNDLYAPVLSTDPPPDNVTVISGSTNLILKYLATGGNSNPTTGVYDPANGYLYVPAIGATLKSHVTVINTATNTVVATIPVGAFPDTPAYDPADGDIYVPNYGSNNLTIINAATDTSVGSISVVLNNNPIVTEDLLTESPVYDSATQAVYQPDTGNVTLTEVKGTSFVRNFTVGPGPQTPAVDPLTGNLFVPIAFTSLVTGSLNDTVSIVNVTSNTVTNVTVGESPETPVYDPANNEMYVACLAPHSDYGVVTALDATTGKVVATINVGVSPVVPAFDSTNDELYVPNFVSDNVTVIGAGPLTSPPGTYPVTFTESGLPPGAWWTITLSGTSINETSLSIVFPGIPNGVYTFTLGTYQDETSCVPTDLSVSGTGSFTVAGSAVTVNVPFSCSGAGGAGGSGSTPVFLGLPGNEGYYLLGGIAAVALAVVGSLLYFRGRRASKPPEGAPVASAPPPGTWTAPPPPPPAPPPPPP